MEKKQKCREKERQVAPLFWFKKSDFILNRLFLFILGLLITRVNVGNDWLLDNLIFGIPTYFLLSVFFMLSLLWSGKKEKSHFKHKSVLFLVSCGVLALKISHFLLYGLSFLFIILDLLYLSCFWVGYYLSNEKYLDFQKRTFILWGLNTFSFIFSLIYGMLLNTFAMDWFSLIIALSLGQLHFNHQLIKNSRMHPALIHQIFGKKFNSRTLINKIDTYGILFLSLILIEFYRSLLVWIPLSFVYLSYFKILKYGKEREKEKEQEKRKNEKEEKEKEEGKRPKKKGDRVKKKQGNYPQNTQVHNKEEIERNIEKWYVRAMIGLFVVLIMFAL